VSGRRRKAPLPVIPVPAAYQPLLKANQPPLHHQLTADQTLQFVALDPPGAAQAAKIQVIGAGAAPPTRTATERWPARGTTQYARPDGHMIMDRGGLV
jgi:hypothetical protein